MGRKAWIARRRAAFYRHGMKSLLALSALTLLAACATPREACVAQQTRDLRVVDGLIAEEEATLARGYALDRRTELRPRLTLCTGLSRGNDGLSTGVRYCSAPETRTRVVPQAVNLGEVQARLDGLRTKRAELSDRAARGAAACRARYPQG